MIFFSKTTMPICMLCFSNRAHPRLVERPQTPTLTFFKHFEKK